MLNKIKFILYFSLFFGAVAAIQAQLMVAACPLPKHREGPTLAEFSAAMPAVSIGPIQSSAKFDDFVSASGVSWISGYSGISDSTTRVKTAAEKRTGWFFRHADRFKIIFADEGVPENLVWLAEVESAFDTHAVSSRGAVGLFQLTPDTAKRFGLCLTPVDERKLPEKSARAAAQYLKHLHDRFGCWSLALAAYNAGEGRVERLLYRHAFNTFDEISPYLPGETRQYVPRVLALALARESDGRMFK